MQDARGSGDELPGATGRSSPDGWVSGVIEGFYGRPWNVRQRHALFGWMRRWGLGTYLYAPKDDPFHRVRWRDPYPDAALAELSALVRDAERHGLAFVYAIGPGLDIQFSSEADLKALTAKLLHVGELGIRRFALLFDDIPLELRGGDAGGFESVAQAQVEAAHRVLAEAIPPEPDGSLWLCPTVYCGRMAGSVEARDYLRELGAKLDRRVEVFWTGSEIVSRSITSEEAGELGQVLGRRPLIWDNLFANDYDPRRVYLGPFSGRPAGLRAATRGLLLNPGCEFEASFVPFRTFSLYASSGEAEWDPVDAHRRAVGEWAWEFRDVDGTFWSEEDVRWLADVFHLPWEQGLRSATFVESVRVLAERPRSEWGGAMEEVRASALRWVGLHDKLTRLQNRELMFALYRFTWELKEEMMFVLAFLEFLAVGGEARDGFRPRELLVGTYRGGMVAALQRLLAPDAAGVFRPAGGGG